MANFFRNGNFFPVCYCQWALYSQPLSAGGGVITVVTLFVRKRFIIGGLGFSLNSEFCK